MWLYSSLPKKNSNECLISSIEFQTKLGEKAASTESSNYFNRREKGKKRSESPSAFLKPDLPDVMSFI